MTLAIFSGSGLYDFPDLNQPHIKNCDTPWGSVEFQAGNIGNQPVLFLARHGINHHYVSHQVPHRAHISACQQLGVEAILALSVVGVINKKLPLGELYLPTELYFPDNRLPNGEACTLFTEPGKKGRGHLLSERHFNSEFSSQLVQAAERCGHIIHQDIEYAYVQGPRFNSKSEVRALAQLKIDVLSQTLGPEAVLAGEAEIPYAALNFGVDYANGVQDTPTPIAILAQNLKLSKTVFIELVKNTAEHYSKPNFEGFVYRF